MPRQAILPAALDATGFRLLNEWQRDFPLEPRPFARIAQAVGAAEEDVIAAYRDLARLAHDEGERIRLVDLANQVRPRTAF